MQYFSFRNETSFDNGRDQLFALYEDDHDRWIGLDQVYCLVFSSSG